MRLRSVGIGSLIFLLAIAKAKAQTVDLFADTSITIASNVTDITTGTFKSTRIVNGQSIENVGAGILDFRILHRFGALSQGGYNFFGLDQATMRLGLDMALIVG